MNIKWSTSSDLWKWEYGEGARDCDKKSFVFILDVYDGWN